MRRLSARNLSLAVAFGALPMFAAAQSDNHGVQRSARGLGQAYPAAADRSADPEWRLYIFERDGFSYFQINDLNGHVEAIIGKAGTRTGFCRPVRVQSMCRRRHRRYLITSCGSKSTGARDSRW